MCKLKRFSFPANACTWDLLTTLAEGRLVGEKLSSFSPSLKSLIKICVHMLFIAKKYLSDNYNHCLHLQCVLKLNYLIIFVSSEIILASTDNYP